MSLEEALDEPKFSGYSQPPEYTRLPARSNFKINRGSGISLSEIFKGGRSLAKGDKFYDEDGDVCTFVSKARDGGVRFTYKKGRVSVSGVLDSDLCYVSEGSLLHLK